jgi:hypothetical protein
MISLVIASTLHFIVKIATNGLGIVEEGAFEKRLLNFCTKVK